MVQNHWEKEIQRKIYIQNFSMQENNILCLFNAPVETKPTDLKCKQHQLCQKLEGYRQKAHNYSIHNRSKITESLYCKYNRNKKRT